LGEGIGVQPVQKLRAPAGDHLQLREVDMGVDEARQDQMRAVVDFRQAGTGEFRVVVHSEDAAIFEQDGAVLEIEVVVVGIGGVGVKAENAAPDQLLHGYLFTKDMSVSRAISSAAAKAAM